MTLQIDEAKFNDLVTFARLEVDSGDLEPWAEIIRQMGAQCSWTEETKLWMVRLYNAFDSLSSAYGAYVLWEHPLDWDTNVGHKEKISTFPHMMERRNLHGGRGAKSFQSYCDLLKAALPGATRETLRSHSQENWLCRGLRYPIPDRLSEQEANFRSMFEHVQQVWGVGRLAGFEWTEFLQKVMGWPISAPDACLWESSGPRKSLELLYRVETPTKAQLDEMASDCRSRLKERGVALPWIDFETVICDFKVMRHGRYYPGRHLAALRQEIEEVVESEERDELLSAWEKIIPEPWSLIAPGIDKAMMPVYKDTGRIMIPALGNHPSVPAISLVVHQ